MLNEKRIESARLQEIERQRVIDDCRHRFSGGQVLSDDTLYIPCTKCGEDFLTLVNQEKVNLDRMPPIQQIGSSLVNNDLEIRHLVGSLNLLEIRQILEDR